MKPMASHRLVPLLAAALAIGAGPAGPALAQTTPAPSPDTARLEGSFQLAGRVTVAEHIRGEHVGERVTRLWTFASLCPTGQCQTVVLVRHRHAGIDTVVLDLRSPGMYSGQGRFAAPLSCDGRTYPKGARVPFTITVNIDTAVLVNDVVVAGRVSATYINAMRINHTPCVAGLGHDAARYHGHLIVPA